MTSKELLKAIQSRTARIAVGASTVRGKGNAGTVSAARLFFNNLNLRLFQIPKEKFPTVLDHETLRLQDALPSNAQHWGISRKLLNIFLRDCFYSLILNTQYMLQDLEHVLELPLDGITAQALKMSATHGALPSWTGVKHLTPENSNAYQQAATEEANKKGIARVHLDAVRWSLERD